MLAARFAALAAKRELEEATIPSCGQERSELRKLIVMMERAAADQPDPVRALAKTIKMLADSEADPYLMIGVLIEGAVHILRASIPAECQSNTAGALLKLVADRLQDADFLPRN